MDLYDAHFIRADQSGFIEFFPETGPEDSNFNIRLFNAQGLLIKEKKHGESYAEMDIKTLGSGSSSKGIVCKRFVKE